MVTTDGSRQPAALCGLQISTRPLVLLSHIHVPSSLQSHHLTAQCYIRGVLPPDVSEVAVKSVLRLSDEAFAYLWPCAPQEGAAGGVKAFEGGGEGVQATAEGVGHRSHQALADAGEQACMWSSIVASPHLYYVKHRQILLASPTRGGSTAKLLAIDAKHVRNVRQACHD